MTKLLTKSRQRPDKDLTTNKKDKECYKNDKEINNPPEQIGEEVLTSEDLYGVDPKEQYRRFLAGELKLNNE